MSRQDNYSIRLIFTLIGLRLLVSLSIFLNGSLRKPFVKFSQLLQFQLLLLVCMGDLIQKTLFYFLYPFSLLYGYILKTRAFLYKKGIFKVQSTSIFSIGIGNITVGGTGKTPHIEYFINEYGAYLKIATLSRGYGRKTKGFLTIDSSMSPEKAGDEPWQFFLKFGKQISVHVGEKRAPAAHQIHRLYPKTDLILMDDVFQHQAVKPDFSILLCDYTRPFFKDFPFPAGRLREFRSGAQRADSIIVSKCPSLITEEERAFFVHQLTRYAKDVPVAFSAVTYGETVPIFKTALKPTSWLLVTGIARPQPLIDHLTSQNALLGHMQYPDHHDFSEAQSMDVMNAYLKLKNPNAGVLITEKDYARLSSATKELWKGLPLFYIPISVKFIEGEELLLQNIKRAVDLKA